MKIEIKVLYTFYNYHLYLQICLHLEFLIPLAFQSVSPKLQALQLLLLEVENFSLLEVVLVWPLSKNLGHI